MANGARLLHYGSPSAEDNEVWDATHVEPSRQFWIVLRSILTTIAFPAISAAARATSGAATRQGPHHSAQKSASTGTRAFWTISSNDSPSTSRGSSTGGKGALQAPQRPVSARRVAGMRFFRPQVLHVRITDIYFTTTNLRRIAVRPLAWMKKSPIRFRI
jgi:hypothetical protein